MNEDWKLEPKQRQGVSVSLGDVAALAHGIAHGTELFICMTTTPRRS
jgi:hydrogenase/urease accessory protein HupE